MIRQISTGSSGGWSQTLKHSTLVSMQPSNKLQRFSISIRCVAALVIFAAVLLAGTPARANVLSWSGGGTSGHCSDSANWGRVGTPLNGDTLIFGAIATSKYATTNNIVTLSLNQIRFNGSSGGFV